MSQFNWPVRVYHEDVDTMAIVYYANYLKYLERARTEWLHSLAIDQKKLHDDYGIWFVVNHLTLDYKQPAKLNDMLDVTAAISRQTRSSIDMKQCIMRDGQCLITATVRLVCVADRDTNGQPVSLRPVAIPEFLLQSWKDYYE